MPWFWSSRQDNVDDEYEDDDDDDECEDEDDYVEEEDEDDESDSEDDGSYESYTDEEDEVGPDIIQIAQATDATDATTSAATTAAATVSPPVSRSSGIQPDELALLTAGSSRPAAAAATATATATATDDEYDNGTHNRSSSAVSDYDDDDENPGWSLGDGGAPLQPPSRKVEGQQQQQEQQQEEEEEETTLEDKQSLLVLAAEHDRVDILQAILAVSSSAASIAPEAMQHQRAFLLNPVVVVVDISVPSDETLGESRRTRQFVTTIPPLHIAVSYGSVNAVNALLRLGADPSLRPNVPAIRAAASSSSVVAVELPPHVQRFHDTTAWELAFGDDDGQSILSAKSKASSSSWSLFRSPSEHDRMSSSALSASSPSSPRKVTAVEMPPSKREGIRHAFTAEALRCIGSDEGPRLVQLLESGLPATTEIGGKTLEDWCVDMGATACQALVRAQTPPAPPPVVATTTATTTVESTTTTTADEATTPLVSSNTIIAPPSDSAKSAVLDRGSWGARLSDMSLIALTNRYVELESLSQALSVCLDNCAEEVSVCAGLLLVGSGSASALATHVRSLKARRDKKHDEWQRMVEINDNSHDELSYWGKQWDQQHRIITGTANTTTNSSSHQSGTTESVDILQLVEQQLDATLSSINGVKNNSQVDHYVATMADLDVGQQQQQLRAQIEAMEHKIRRLRAAIADLSEENARNLNAVEKRGLSGGIALVRTLREEIRDIEYQYADAQSEEAACRAKIRLVQAKVKSAKAKVQPPVDAVVAESATATTRNDMMVVNDMIDSNKLHPNVPELNDDDDTRKMPNSERMASGYSTAIVVRNGSGARGFLSFNLWQILMRIMGMNDTGSQRTADSSNRHSAPATPVMVI